MANGRKGPIEQSAFKDAKQFKAYDGTGKDAGMPAYDELLADTELYWGLGKYDAPKEDRTADKTKRPAKEFPTEHQDLFIRLAEHVGTDVLYNWLHQPHKLSMAGLKPGIKPKALPVDCRLPYFDDDKKLVGTDQFAEYLDHLAKGGEWPDAPRLTASYINFMTERAQAKRAKETEAEKAPEPPPKPGPAKPVEGPKPPPPKPLGPPGTVPVGIYGVQIDLNNVRPMDIELPDKPGYKMKVWPINDYNRIVEDLDDICSRIAEETERSNAVLQGIPANLEIKAIASYLQSIIEREEENKPALIKQKKSKKAKKAAAPEVEESEEMRNIRYAAEVLGRYTSNQDVRFTPEELQLFAEAMNGVCSSVDDLYEHYKSQAMSFAKRVAGQHFQKKQYTYFGKMVQNTDYTDELLAVIKEAFDHPEDADILFTNIRVARVASRRGQKADYGYGDPHEYFLGLEQLEKLQGMLNIPTDQVDPRRQTFPAHVRELANKLVTWADMKFFIRALEEGNVKPFEGLTKELKNRREGVPKVCAALVYNANEGVTADSELLLLDLNGRPDTIKIENYVTESVTDDEQGAKVMEHRLRNAFEALLMVGQEIIPDEQTERIEPEPQDGPLPPPPLYLGPPSPPPGPPEPRYGPNPGPPLPSPYQLALPGPPQDGKDEDVPLLDGSTIEADGEENFTEVDEIEDDDDEKKSNFEVNKIKKPADAQDKDIELECPLCGASVDEHHKKCPECGVDFEHNEEGEK
jgi:hypothetical protein